MKTTHIYEIAIRIIGLIAIIISIYFLAALVSSLIATSHGYVLQAGVDSYVVTRHLISEMIAFFLVGVVLIIGAPAFCGIFASRSDGDKTNPKTDA